MGVSTMGGWLVERQIIIVTATRATNNNNNNNKKSLESFSFEDFWFPVDGMAFFCLQEKNKKQNRFVTADGNSQRNIDPL